MATNASAIDTSPEVWNNEFQNLHVIPSSTRSEGAKPLRLFSGILPFEQYKLVLDAGTGNGRNAAWLANKGCRVIAADFSKVALKLTAEARRKARLLGNLHLCNCALDQELPFLGGSFDLVIDSYVFCHFIDTGVARAYIEQLYRVIKRGGVVFTSVFSPDDEYYKEMICENTEHGPVAFDPNNHIAKQLYSESAFKDVFALYFQELYYVRFNFHDVVLGRRYKRDILIQILRKPQ